MELAFRSQGNGKPLIVLHGLFGQSDNWNTLARQWSEKGFQVFTLDLRNHGLSPHSDVWNYEAMAEDLQEFIVKHQLAKPILLGHSMGGKVVLFHEKKYPQQCKGLIIADISPRAYEAHHQIVLEALNAVNFDIIKTRREAEAILASKGLDEGTKQFLLKNLYWANTDNTRLNWRFNLSVIEKNYANIGVEVPFYRSASPVKIIYGLKSNYVNENDENDFSNRFSNLEFHGIEAGHWVHAEKPIEFFESVLDFANKIN